MKVLIVFVCSVSVLARASLEPVGYRPPGSHHQSSYLPPSASHNVPDNRYIPSAVGSNSHPSATFNNQVSNSYSLPTKNSPVSFSQYLPANRQPKYQGVATSHGNNFGQNLARSNHYIPANENKNSLTRNFPVSDYQGVGSTHGSNFGQNLVPSNQYIPANENQNSFTHNLPVSDYLPPRQNQNRNSRPSNAYLSPNVHFGHSTDGFASTGHYSGAASVNRHNKIDQGNSGHYSLGYRDQHSNTGSSGYQYNAPENNVPAKYDFEYKVKDNYGNDYGHKETRNGENTQGVYTVLLPDGRRQIVHYEADSHGYRPTITYEETGSQSGYNNNQGYQY